MNASALHVSLVLLVSVLVTACGGGASSSIGHDVSDRQAFDSNDYVAKKINHDAIVDVQLRDCIESSGAVDTSPQTFDCSRYKISSLAGIEQFGDLRVLNVSNNELSDVSELSNLDRLSYLDVSHNKLSSLHPLSTTKKLNRLIANNNSLFSIDELGDLQNLQALHVSNNFIANFDFITQLSSLEYINASNNGAVFPRVIPKSVKKSHW